MLTPEEIAALESLLHRARHDRPLVEAIQPGDVVQIRPGADAQWDTSLLLVGRVRDGKVSGEILRPHRGGWRDAWYSYTPPEVVRIGRSPFPEPPIGIRGAGYWPACPSCHNLAREQGEEERKKARKRRSVELRNSAK